MSSFSSTLRESRIALGITQAELSIRSGISVPTIQNLEAGKGNPELSTIESLFGALGLRWKIDLGETDWNLLALCGAPLSSLSKAQRDTPKITSEVLFQTLRQACFELETRPGDDPERKREAVQALLLALQIHYPSVYKTMSRVPVIEAVAPKRLTGRLIKLKRQASACLAEYL